MCLIAKILNSHICECAELLQNLVRFCLGTFLIIEGWHWHFLIHMCEIKCSDQFLLTFCAIKVENTNLL